MKQIVIPKNGGPEVLKVEEAPDPNPGPGEVRIEVKAAGVNFADLMARIGVYPDAPPLPGVVGYEVAGIIDAVGEGVDPSRVGERVAALTRFGGYSSSLCVPENQAIGIPDEMEFSTAASIPVTGLTAWMMLEEMGRVRQGDRVLVHSAGGGVGLMALDLIKNRGAVAVGTASEAKHGFLYDRGYDLLVDYRNEDYAEVLKDEEGFDLVLDPIGGKSWEKGLELLRPAGRLIVFGFSANAGSDTRSLIHVLKNLAEVPWVKLSPIPLMNANKGVMGVNFGKMWGEAERVAPWLKRLMELVDAGKVRPLVHARVPFSEAARAHEILHNRENIGKVVLFPD
jgi:NADPH:quinone reductase-like Zn-dependent oxidoreductase